MSYCANCGKYISDGGRFCVNCGAPVTDTEDASISKRTIVQDGTIHKCPNCGEVINSFTATCPTCGYEFRGINATSSVQMFTKELSKTTSAEQKVSIIRSFPIPNTKEDILEFMLLASTNIFGEQEKRVFDAWLVKFDQSYQKAKIVITDEGNLQTFQDIYDKTQKQIKRERRKRRVQTAGRTLSQSGAASKIALLIGKNLAVVAGIVLFIMAIITDSKHGNSSALELFGAILLIASAATLARRKASLIEFVIGALSGILSLCMARFLKNGSVLELSGGLILIIVAVNFFRRSVKKDTDKKGE